MAYLTGDHYESDEVHAENLKKNDDAYEELSKAYLYLQSKTLVATGTMIDNNLGVFIATESNYLPFIPDNIGKYYQPLLVLMTPKNQDSEVTHRYRFPEN